MASWGDWIGRLYPVLLADVLAENQSIFIPKGVSHRVQNPGKLPLVIVQVQTGDYFGADDVVRIEEPYRQRAQRPAAPAAAPAKV